MNILHYIETVAATADEAAPFSIADAFYNDCVDNLEAYLSEDWSAVSYQVFRRIYGYTNPYTLVASGAYAAVGGVSAEAIPSNSPMVVTKYSNEASKSGRGRWYQSGIPETSQNAGQMIAADAVNIKDALEGALTTVVETAGGAGRWNAIVFSTVHAPVFGTFLIQYLQARPNLANMRPRRSPAVGL